MNKLPVYLSIFDSLEDNLHLYADITRCEWGLYQKCAEPKTRPTTIFWIYLKTDFKCSNITDFKCFPKVSHLHWNIKKKYNNNNIYIYIYIYIYHWDYINLTNLKFSCHSSGRFEWCKIKLKNVCQYCSPLVPSLHYINRFMYADTSRQNHSPSCWCMKCSCSCTLAPHCYSSPHICRQTRRVVYRRCL